MLRSKGRPNDDIRDYVEALAPAPYEVTEREAEVARLLTWHFSSPQIAEELGISISTAKAHVGQLLLKFRCEDRGMVAGEVRRIVREFREARDRRLRAKQANLRIVRRKKDAPLGRAANGKRPAIPVWCGAEDGVEGRRACATPSVSRPAPRRARPSGRAA